MRPRRPGRLATLDVVEAFFVGHCLIALRDLQILEALKRPLTADALAACKRFDPALLRGTLDYVAARTTLLRKIGARFVTTKDYATESRFLLDLYAGAFRNNAAQLSRLLRSPAAAPRLVDRARHARAFAEVQPQAFGWMAAVVRQFGLNDLLDLGCGPAALLIELATHEPNFVGWGLDSNPAMVKTARKTIRAAKVGRQLKILHGETADLDRALPEKIRARVRSVSACQVVNEFFGQGSARAIAWLRGLRRALPERPLLLADYYGRLGSAARHQDRQTLLHDYAQLISGQGVPPPNLKGWAKLYSAAGCRLLHVLEDRSTSRFVHLLLL